MGQNKFNKIYYYGLTIIFSPIIFVGFMYLLIFVTGDRHKENEKQEVKIETKIEKVLVHDTVFVKPNINLQNSKPKTVSTPITKDTIKITDTSNSKQ